MGREATHVAKIPMPSRRPFFRIVPGMYPVFYAQKFGKSAFAQQHQSTSPASFLKPAAPAVWLVRRNRQSLLESTPRFTSHTRGYVGLF